MDIGAKHLQVTDELQEQASLYAIGAMPEGERLKYVRHLEEDDCSVCRQEVAEFQAVAGLLVLDSSLETPSARAKSRLMEQVRAAAPSMISSSVPRPRRWLEWTASLAAIAASTALIVVLNENAQLRSLTTSLSSRVAQLEEQITAQTVKLATLTSTQVRVVNLAGQAGNAGASGRIFWDQTRHRWFFYVQNLPPVASDKSYQLWFVPVAGNPVSASVFNTNANGTAEIEIPLPNAVDQLKAAAVTTEPAGGLPQPSGAFALLGAAN